MIVTVRDDVRVVSDTNQFIVQRKAGKPDKKGNPIWRGDTYHRTLGAAFNSIVRHEIMTDDSIEFDVRDAESILKAIDSIKEITDRITSKFEPTFRVVEGRDYV